MLLGKLDKRNPTFAAVRILQICLILALLRRLLLVEGREEPARVTLMISWSTLEKRSDAVDTSCPPSTIGAPSLIFWKTNNVRRLVTPQHI